MTSEVFVSSAVSNEDLIIDILDVGHGSCVVVRTPSATHLIDTGPGGPILEYLFTEGISEIDTIIISHADQDHIGGLAALLGQKIPVGKVIWNADSIKRSSIWRDLVYQIDEIENERGSVLSHEAAAHVQVATGSSGIYIELVAPRTRLRQLGAGGRDRENHAISTNTMSVVVRIVVDGIGILLVPGDLDKLGYQHMADVVAPNLRAKYLVLPHHGGLSGTPGATRELVSSLMELTVPEVVFISNGRGRYENPRQLVLDSVKVVSPGAPVACTQLAEHCSSDVKMQSPRSGPYSVGMTSGRSCAGSIRITRSNGIDNVWSRMNHALFIQREVLTPACAGNAVALNTVGQAEG